MVFQFAEIDFQGLTIIAFSLMHFFYRVFMRLRPVKRLTLPVLKEQMKENEFHANQLLSKKVKGLNNKSIANYQPTRKES